MADKESIGFIGLGVMGLPMARNLLRAGHALKVWNRTPARYAALYAQAPAPDAGTPPPATAVAHPADLAQCSVVCVNLADDAALESVLFGPDGLATTPGHAIVIDLGTTSPRLTRATAERLAARGLALVDAPVSGGEAGAKAATLSIMVGAPATLFARVRPLLECLGSTIVHVGDSGAGQIAKACNQIVVSATLLGVAEALHFARRQGVDPARVRTALLGGSAYSKILEIHGQRMLDSDDQPGFRARLHKKDLDIVLAEAAALGLDLESIGPAARRMTELVEAGRGEADSSAIHSLLDSADK